jgi:hypothetical protein
MMNIDIEQLEAAFALVIEGIEKQDMPAHLKKDGRGRRKKLETV